MRPKSSAPRLMRFAVKPKRFIARKANNSESGITEAVRSDARRLRRNRKRIAMTSSAPSVRFVNIV